MRRKNPLSINHICLFLGVVLLMATIGISIAVLWITRNVVVTLCVLGFGVFAFGCGVRFCKDCPVKNWSYFPTSFVNCWTG